MSLSEIRARDRNAVARLGNPNTDTLLRAEMDRRELLRRLDKIRDAIENEGISPGYHCRVMAQHKSEWPTLWRAIEEALND